MTLKRHQTPGQRTCMQTTINSCQVHSQKCSATTLRHSHYHTCTLHVSVLTTADVDIATDRRCLALPMHLACKQLPIHGKHIFNIYMQVLQCTGIITRHSHNHVLTLQTPLSAPTDRAPPGQATTLAKHSACKNCQCMFSR